MTGSYRLRILGGIAAAIAIVVFPSITRDAFAIAVVTQMGIMVIFALSFNIIFGQSGMLSFGHAAFYGLGAFFSAHSMNLMASLSSPTPLPLVPFIGGFTALIFGIIFGLIATRTVGAIFGLVTLGIGELVRTMLDLVPRFSGGESGVVTNRIIGTPLLGASFGTPVEIYFLVAVWMGVCLFAIYFLTLTPLGRMANAVRDNPERAAFTGYSVSFIRFLQYCLSAFFAGIAGALSAINSEFVSVESVGLFNSGSVLFATVIGGSSLFLGPVVGAVVFVFFVSFLSIFTSAWMLYLGVFFLIVIFYLPGGLMGGGLTLLAACQAANRQELASIVFRATAVVSVTLGGVGLIETLYQFSKTGRAAFTLSHTLPFDLGQILVWVASAILLVGGLISIIVLHLRQRMVAPGVKA